MGSRGFALAASEAGVDAVIVVDLPPEEGDDFFRSLARHLLVYALGRGLTSADEDAVAQLVAALRADPTFPALVGAVTGLDAFLRQPPARTETR